MATFDAIATVGLALRAVLTQAAGTTFPDARFELFQATDFDAAPSGAGIAIYLYRIGANTTPRALPPRSTWDGRRFRPSLPLDLHYLLAPFGPTAETQHRLLGWSMRVLEDTPSLPAAFLNAADANAPTFQPNETVEVIYDSLSLQDLASIWDIADPKKIQLAATYIVRRILIDSEIELIEGPAVQTRDFGFGKLQLAEPAGAVPA